MNDLKPCPFGCGGAIYEMEHTKEWPHTWLRHSSPNGELCPAEGEHELEDWNRRAPRFSPEEREALDRARRCLNLTPDFGGLYSAVEDDDLAAATIRKMLEEK